MSYSALSSRVAQMTFWIVLAVLLMRGVEASRAADFYVSPAGSNTNPGTLALPWATISRALGTLAPGDTLHVLDGDYSESVHISGLRGNAGAPITILGHGLPKVAATGQDVFLIDGGSAWLVLEGMELTGGSRSGVIVTKSTQIVIRGCVIHHNAKWGVQTCLADHITVEGSELFASAQEHGIYFSTTDYPTARNNLVHDNPRCGIHMNGDLSEGGDGMITGATITGNVIHHCGWDGGAAINMDGVESSLIADNLVYENEAGGITSYKWDGLHGGTRNEFYFNTVYFAPGAGRFGLQLYGGSTDAVVMNNILICRSAALEADTQSLPGLQSDHNIFVRHGSSTPISAGGTYSLSTWRAVSGLDMHSLDAMPQFSDLAADDYRLVSASPGVDDGTAVAAITSDLSGQSREQGTAPDIGAFELQTSSPPPAAGTGLLGEYFQNMDLTDLALTRTDATVDFVWPRGTSPDATLDEETFSVRWYGTVMPRVAGTHTFHTVTDDGVRLWVDGLLLIDDWTDHSAKERTGSISLSAGQKVSIIMEYYDGRLDARAQLFWSSPSLPKEIVPRECLYPATPAEPPPPEGEGCGLLGEYFHDTALSQPALSRTDATVDFVWPRGTPPDPAMDEETFSVRWSGEVEPLYSETYAFHTITDDGVRLWVDGVLLTNDWTDHSAKERTATIDLSAGQRVSIVMEYYDNRYDARAQLLWSSSSQPKEIIPADRLYPAGGPPPVGQGTGLVGEYFHDMALSQPALTRADSTVDFVWPRGASPDPSMDGETFSVRWSGLIEPVYSETYTFHTVADDGVRLWVDGVLVTNDWSDHSSRESSGSIQHTAGRKVGIVMEYYDNRLDARAQLLWSSPSQPKEIVPTTALYAE